MNNKMKLILQILLFTAIFAAAYFAYAKLSEKTPPAPPANTQKDGEDGTKEKIEAPDFTVLDVDGNEIKLSSLIGKPIVLNFWASWCPPCKSEMPDFQKVYEALGEDVQFLMINSTDGNRETVESAKEYIEEKSFTFPVYFDTAGDASGTYGVSALPSTLLIDAEGYVTIAIKGPVDEAWLLREIENITPDKEQK